MAYEDYHVHSDFSDDSSYEMEQVVKDAIEKGMDALCFTDHVDYGIKLDWEGCPPEILAKAGTVDDDAWVPGMERIVMNVNYPEYFPKIEALQKKYKDQIVIHKGLEFGIQSHTIDSYQKLYERYKDQLDFVLLSIHQVGDKEFWTQEFQQGHTQLEYNRVYYEELLKVIRAFKNYSVLAHLDLIVRYDKAGKIDFESVKDLVEEILKTAIADGKGIEINTSSVRYRMGDLHPSTEILKLYKDLGGKIITFGSDSHKPEHLGVGIEEQKQMVKDLGFETYCTFENMQPVFHPL